MTTKEKILRISLQEFSIHGYDAVSMNNLAKKLELNKATIYYHFKDKNSLYQEVIKDLIVSNQLEIDEILNSDKDPKEKFILYTKSIILKINDNPQIIPIIQREMANFGKNIENGIEAEIEQDYNNIKTLLAGLNLKEKYKNMDLYLIKAMIMGTINTYYSMNMSTLDIAKRKDFKKEEEILIYLNNILPEILLDFLCE